MRIHIINPNRLTAVTHRLELSARHVARPGTEIQAVSGPGGPESVESHTEELLGGMAVARAVVQGAADGADAFVIACFGDTGVHAARELTGRPVVGMSEAAYYTAAMLAARFTVVTLPSRTQVHAIRVLHETGLTHRAGVEAVEAAVVDLEHEAATLLPIFLDRGRRALARDNSEAIVLGCAGLSELVEPLQAELGVPVIDGVLAAVTMAEGLVAAGLSTSSHSTYAHPGAAAVTGVSR